MSILLERLDTGQTYEATITADLPANNVVLAPQAAIHNGAVAEAVEIDILSIYYETPY
jgi:hypothetical protein